MKNYFLFLLFLALSLHTWAGDIKGRIVDAKSKTPLDFVNISVNRMGNNTPLKGATTDSKGLFAITGLAHGNYQLKISFVGYNTIILPITLSVEYPNADLKTMQMTTNTRELKEVQVVGQRSQVRFEVDKKVFNVDQNIAATGGSATDALQNIPSVDVDTEGNVSLRNNSNVVVWINGKPSGLTEENRAQILEQMPAGSIESVEVITNPSAKYSPEGSAGIINLILKKDRKAGYFGSVSANGTTLGGGNLGVNLNVNTSKFDYYANVGARYMNFPMETETYRESWKNDVNDKTILRQDNTGKRYGYGIMLRTGGTYRITDNDEWGLNVFGMLGNRKSENDLYSRDNDFNLTKERFSHSDGRHDMISVNTDYLHKFSKTSDLKLYAEYSVGNPNSDTDFEQRILTSGFTNAQRQNTKNTGGRWTFQADYMNQLNKMFKIEAGYKGTLNDLNSTVVTYEGADLNNMVPLASLNNRFDYKENIQALYAAFSGRVKQFGFQAGLRGEYMKYNTVTEAEDAREPFSKDYFQLFPSVFLSYSLPSNNELQVNYTRRVNRPRGRQLNPFRNITDSTNITYGNPNLRPEYTNALEMNYIKSWDEHTLSTSIYYRTTDGVIQQVRYFEDPVMYSTSENITSSQRAGLELVSKNKLFKVLDITTTVNLYYYNLEPFSYNYMNKGVSYTSFYDGDKNFSWDIRAMLNCILPWGIMAQVSGSYRSKQIVAQGERLPSYSLDAGLRKSFFDRKLSVAISARDLLDSHRSKSITWGDNFYQKSDMKFGGRSFGLTLTYMFGNSKNAKAKKNNRENGENNVDSEMMDF